MKFVVAVDAGTTGVRSLVVDEQGTIVDIAYKELTQYFPSPGWFEHDPTEIWRAVRATLLEVAERLGSKGYGSPEVSAIGITNQRETVVAWDPSTGEPLHRAIVWQDRRTTERCLELRAAGHLPTIRSRTGLVLDPYFSATKIAWLLDRFGLREITSEPNFQHKIAFGTVDSWILWNLTGGVKGGTFATDPTNASRTLLFDINKRCWDMELCELFNVPSECLPEVLPSCGRFGVLSPDAVTPASGGHTSWIVGTPISGIAGDQHAALFGQACFEPGATKVTYGTGSFVLTNTGASALEPAAGLLTTIAWDLGVHAGTETRVSYALEGSAFSSGAAIQWLRDGLGIVERTEEIEPLARSVSDSAGVAFVPAFAGLGSPWWDPAARGTITGITRGANRAHIARAGVESIAFQVHAIIDAMSAASALPVSVMRADGGAAAMDLLLSLQSDISQLSIYRPKSMESTALGAAMLAGLAEGVWESLEDLARLWRQDAEFSPALEAGASELAYQGWLRAVERSRNWAKE